MSEKTQITAVDLHYDFENTFIDFPGRIVVEKGDYVCIIGDNGSGKSTFVKTLLGLTKPQRGAFSIGIPKKKIGYLPQFGDTKDDFPATVLEIVRTGLLSSRRLFSFRKKDEDEKIKAMLFAFGIVSLADRSFRVLSGGQKQKVLLCRALLSEPELIILDEPVAGLDPEATADLYRKIRELNRSGVTVVMVTHDMLPVRNDATHILRIGSEYFFGTREAYLQSHDIGDAL